MTMPQDIPGAYLEIPGEEVTARTWAAKKALGSDAVILGHHYQRDEIVQFADFRGDSLKLSRMAAEQGSSRYIVFCGVHFMAETADIVKTAGQTVILPDLHAGCSMADMADIDRVEECWDVLSAQGDFLPITYINSSADLKAFCGKHDGAVCTSSNAKDILAWGFAMGKKILFFPDEHLGRNSAFAMGLPLSEMAVWDPDAADPAAFSADGARIVLWKGYCAVHQRFTAAHMNAIRRSDPDMRIIVHPECCHEVVRQADAVGSTEHIITTVTASPPGSRWAVGTEINMVHRLARENPDKTIVSLNPTVCLCSTMYRIDPHHLLWVLESLVKGDAVNVITVPPEIAEWARVALSRMMAPR